jgi:hypothetical protein
MKLNTLWRIAILILGLSGLSAFAGNWQSSHYDSNGRWVNESGSIEADGSYHWRASSPDGSYIYGNGWIEQDGSWRQNWYDSSGNFGSGYGNQQP